MRLLSIILIVFLNLSVLAGCTTSPGQNLGGFLTKKQVLKLDPDADIFELRGKVYRTGTNWIEEVELTKEEQIGEITEGMANKLPVGAKIFVSKEREDILIVDNNGKEIRYLLQLGE